MRFTYKKLKICLGTLCLLPFLAGGSPQFIKATFFMSNNKSTVEVGQKFNRLTVISFLEKNPNLKSRNRKWLCRCDCGNTTKVVSYELKSGRTKSCGCMRTERIGNSRRTHGMSKTPEYGIWCDIIKRTENERCDAYKYYGGRGIKVSLEWRNSFIQFLRDMGPRPSINHTIDRTNNNGNYEASNCKWVLLDVQARNKRNNIRIEFNGEVKILEDWARSLGMSRSSFKWFLTKNNQYQIL